MSRRWLVVWSALLLVAVGACGDGPDRMTDEEATSRFADCLERNGVEAATVSVTLDADGGIGTIQAQIVSEGDVPYEPTVRLACVAEVEGSSAPDS